MLRSYLQKCTSKQFYQNVRAQYYSTISKPAFQASDYVQIQETCGVREITLHNPQTRNSLSKDMMAAIKEAIVKNQDDIQLRAIVLSASGKVWSAGHNLKEISKAMQKTNKNLNDNCESEASNAFKDLYELIQTIIKSPVPVVAKVDGYAAAAGLQLALSCDITICTKRSQFSTPGSHVGIFCSTPGVAVSRLIPRSQALYMLFTGLPISADEALQTGLVSRVVPDGELDEAVEYFTSQLKKSSRAVVAHGKSTFYKTVDLPLEKAYTVACEAMMTNLKIPDAQEGVGSFLEKRKPNWTHKDD